MKQNKGRSFASLAKSLNTKYANRVNDKLLEAEYHDEMQKLVQQQEAARAQMGLTNDNGQDRMMPEQFGGLNPNGQYLPNSPVPASQLPWRQDSVNFGLPQSITDMIEQSKITPTRTPVSNIIPTINAKSSQVKKVAIDNRNSAYWDKMAKDANPNMDIPIVSSNVGKWDSLKPELPSGQMNIAPYEAPASSLSQKYQKPNLNVVGDIIPGLGDAVDNNKTLSSGKIVGDKSDLTNSYISAGATALNNILQGVLTKKPKSIAAPSYTPKELDLSDRALEAKRQAELSSNVARNQARNLGLNAGATIANQAGAQSGIDRNLAGALTDINLAEQQYNVGEQNKAGMFNAEAKYKNDLINQQLKDQYDQRMLDSLSGTIGTIPELITDINKIKAQNKAFKNMTESEKAKFKLYEQLFPRYKGTGFDNSGNVGGLIFNKG